MPFDETPIYAALWREDTTRKLDEFCAEYTDVPRRDPSGRGNEAVGESGGSPTMPGYGASWPLLVAAALVLALVVTVCAVYR